ncbi:energy transducer TonB [Yunchengibacter salinarum]|uniref:energy transducer TonB n=1 Tax=Yunchengibacter salinarum TaxID=3133399 RepID=UPI0035B5D9FE
MKSIAKMVALVAITAASVLAAPTAQANMKDWAQMVMKKVAKEQRYPRSALMREVEGRAKVRLSVTKDGTIAGFELTEPTGSAILDREVERLMERLSPLPDLPGGNEQISFTLPLVWTLS